MFSDSAVDAWIVRGVATSLGGRLIVPRWRSPLAKVLPYRRASGERPVDNGVARKISQMGWSAVLAENKLGDFILALSVAQAFSDGICGFKELHYKGSHPNLMRRCSLDMSTSYSDGEHVVGVEHRGAFTFCAIPDEAPAQLDIIDDEYVEVHTALPMRYYLSIEQVLGIRLPADYAPLPTFKSCEISKPFHVVFIASTSWKIRKDYGIVGFTRVAEELLRRHCAPWTFTFIAGYGEPLPALDSARILSNIDASDCVDVFASADLIIGNDTGLTHLAALTQRLDGSSPNVIGIYGRHAYTKWTTGRTGHHAIATPFSQMLSLSNRCPVRDELDDSLWVRSASLNSIGPETIADFAIEIIQRR